MRLMFYLLVFVLFVEFGIWSGVSSTIFVLILVALAALEILAGLVWHFIKKD